MAVQRLRLKMLAVDASQLAVRSGRVTVAPVSLTSGQLKALRADMPRATYASRERVVSLPTGTAPTERLAAAEAALDALVGAAAG